MNTKSLDILENAQLPPVQARAILQVMEAEFALETLATKADLTMFAARLEQQIGQLGDMVRTLDAKMNALDVKVGAVDAKVNALDVKVNALDAKVTALDAKVNALDAKVTALDAKVSSVDVKANTLDVKVEGVESRLTRWVFTTMLAQTAVLFGAMYFALTHLQR